MTKHRVVDPDRGYRRRKRAQERRAAYLASLKPEVGIPLDLLMAAKDAGEAGKKEGGGEQ